MEAALETLAPSDPATGIVDRIRTARRDRGLGCVRAGALAGGIDPAYWRRIEQGRANPSLRTLRRMAAAVGLEGVL